MWTLPYPPSLNHYWRTFRGRTVISRAGRRFRERVCALLAGRPPTLTDRIAMVMDVYPPDRRRRDLDNVQKPSIDAMEHAGVYADDSQIDWLLTRRCQVVPDGQLIVRVSELPLTRCPVCGQTMNLHS